MTGSRLPSGRPVICLITDRRLVDNLDRAVTAAVAGGVNMVQLREKDLPTRDLLDLGNRVRDAIAGRALLLINGRADIAFAVGADGVHLPADGLPTDGARATLGAGSIIGRAVHSAAEVTGPETLGADYLELGTIFPSRSHPAGAPLGLPALRSATGARIPLIAVGGITAGNVAEVIAAGVAGIAVISAILGESDPKAASERLSVATEKAWAQRVVVGA